MSVHREYRHLLLRMGQSSLAREARKLVVRESLATFILGVLSVSLGVIVLIALGAGIGGRPAGAYLDHTGAWGVTAVIGELLGLAGIVLAQKRHGAIAPLSILGTLLCLSHFVLFLCMTP